MISVSVPGKIHLLGEHAVVYGKPALLSAINLRIYLKLVPLSHPEHFSPRHPDRSLLRHPERSSEGSQDSKIKPRDSSTSLRNDNMVPASEIKPLQKVLEKNVKKRFSIKTIPSYKLSISSELPIGSGLGSSAAISVGLTVALLKLLKIKSDKELVYELALEGEKLFHGNPSGADVMAVINGNFIWFRKETPVFKTYSSLLFPKTKGLKDFYLIDSGKPKESTKQMVELVFKRLEKERPKLEKIFIRQEELTREILIALEESNEQMVMRIIKEGQRNLEKLGVVGDKARGIIRKVEKVGGVGKILGGGGVKEGSGMLLIYCKDKKKLENLSEQEKWNIIPIQLGEEGLQIL